MNAQLPITFSSRRRNSTEKSHRGQIFASSSRANCKLLFIFVMASLLLQAPMTHAQKIKPDVTKGPGNSVNTVTGVNGISPGETSTYESPVTFGMVVTPSTCTTNATGTFYDNGSYIGSSPFNALGLGTLTISSLPVGTNSITATFSGNVVGTEVCNASTSNPPVVLTVNPAQSYQGIVYPKYVVVGVTYAPPGTTSDVQYTGTTSVGSTSTYSNSFSQGYSVGVSSSYGIGIPDGTPTTSGGVTLTVGATTTSTQTQNSSSSVTINKSTSVSFQTAGYPTTYSPSGTPPPTFPDDYDTIQVWLNPELIFTAYEGNPSTIQWNGYAYDAYDQAGPDIASIQVGCLNGDFAVTYCATQQGVLNRAWVTTEPIAQMSPTTTTAVTASGCTPQSTESPSICPNTQDAYNILASDPLAYNPGGSAYTLFNSQPLPVTTADGRFTQISGTNDPNPVQYVPGEKESYTLTQMNTQVQSNGGSQKFEEKITISATVNKGFLNIFNQKTTYTNTDDFTQMSTWLNTLTTTQTVTNAFAIQGSTPPNYVPGEFIAYQDNLYGTFVLIPSN